MKARSRDAPRRLRRGPKASTRPRRRHDKGNKVTKMRQVMAQKRFLLAKNVLTTTRSLHNTHSETSWLVLVDVTVECACVSWHVT